MTSRKKFIVTAVTAGLIAFLCCGVPLIFFGLVFGTSDSGSPQLAAEWRAALEPLPDPEAARKANPEIEVHQFPNGEWVIGFSRDSHASVFERGRGTLVVKDSRGEIRTFFGHVCGSRRLEKAFRSTPSLDAFYKSLPTHHLVEQKSD